MASGCRFTGLLVLAFSLSGFMSAAPVQAQISCGTQPVLKNRKLVRQLDAAITDILQKPLADPELATAIVHQINQIAKGRKPERFAVIKDYYFNGVCFGILTGQASWPGDRARNIRQLKKLLSGLQPVTSTSKAARSAEPSASDTSGTSANLSAKQKPNDQSGQKPPAKIGDRLQPQAMPAQTPDSRARPGPMPSAPFSYEMRPGEHTGISRPGQAHVSRVLICAPDQQDEPTAADNAPATPCDRFRRLLPGTRSAWVEFIVPGRLVIGRKNEIRAVLRHNGGAQHTGSAAIYLEARLQGPTFLISPRAAQEAAVSGPSATLWQWEIIPRTTGPGQPLNLTIAIPTHSAARSGIKRRFVGAQTVLVTVKADWYSGVQRFYQHLSSPMQFVLIGVLIIVPGLLVWGVIGGGGNRSRNRRRK